MADYKKIKEDIINRAETDSTFRDELKKDPKGTIEKYYPRQMAPPFPPNMNVVVVEDSGNTIFINIAPPETVKEGY